MRNGIITNAMNKILENVFTSCFPAILNKCTFGTSSREIFYLSHEMKGSVEVAKSSFLNVRMKGYAFKCTWIALQQFSSMKLNPSPCQSDPGKSCWHLQPRVFCITLHKLCDVLFSAWYSAPMHSGKSMQGVVQNVKNGAHVMVEMFATDGLNIHIRHFLDTDFRKVGVNN